MPRKGEAAAIIDQVNSSMVPQVSMADHEALVKLLRQFVDFQTSQVEIDRLPPRTALLLVSAKGTDELEHPTVQALARGDCPGAHGVGSQEVARIESDCPFGGVDGWGRGITFAVHERFCLGDEPGEGPDVDSAEIRIESDHPFAVEDEPVVAQESPESVERDDKRLVHIAGRRVGPHLFAEFFFRDVPSAEGDEHLEQFQRLLLDLAAETDRSAVPDKPEPAQGMDF